MKKISNFASWTFADDVTAGTAVIETEEQTGVDQGKVNGIIAEIAETVLVLSAVLAIWIPIMALLV